MKKILIIEDDKVLANVCYNQLMSAGYRVNVAPDGEVGLTMLVEFKPDIIILDLMLPQMSGTEFIKHVRALPEFARIPIIVFSNAYLTDVIQESWKAGATKFVSKSDCSPSGLAEKVGQTLGVVAATPFAASSSGPPAPTATPASSNGRPEPLVQSDLQTAFLQNQPAMLAALRTGLKTLIKAGNQTEQLYEIHDLGRLVHSLGGNAGIAGLNQIAHLADALEALLQELHEKPAGINPSTLRTVASGIDLLGALFAAGTPPPGTMDLTAARILVVDDDEISRRAISYSLEKARLQSVNANSAEAAYKMLAEQPFDLVFLDVDMPEMSGFELCTKVRALPAHKKTPIVFVTILSGFEHRTSSTMAGGTDFIAKPFLFIELTVKALIHLLRGKLEWRRD